MKIFISYARVDKPFCTKLVERLKAHEVWFDARLYASQHWWNEIMSRLDWCDAFIYLMSEESINSMYCQREFEIALKLNRPIIPILINQDIDIPPKLAQRQYIDMTGNLNADNINELLDALLHIERELPHRKKRRIKNTNGRPVVNDISEALEMVRDGAKAMQEGDYDTAIVLFNQVKASGFQSELVDIDRLIKIAEDAMERIVRLKVAKREYRTVLALLEYESTRDYGIEVLKNYLRKFSDYDPQNLASIYLKDSHSHEPKETSTITTGSEIDFGNTLPMLRWVSVNGGMVEVPSVESNGEHFNEMNVNVKPFETSQYPVTNAQFDIFVTSHDGYMNPRWWKFSKAAKAWFDKHGEPLASQFKGDDRPREKVNWYEALAFCNWLSYTLGMKITLPTVAQWQRAAQGDDERFYPWGNDYKEEYCNTRECKIKSTTPVNRYEKGVSPFGVYDMSGNVWEWLLDNAPPADGTPDYRRAVMGGSFLSRCELALISCRHYIGPIVRYPSIGFRLVRIK